MLLYSANAIDGKVINIVNAACVYTGVFDTAPKYYIAFELNSRTEYWRYDEESYRDGDFRALLRMGGEVVGGDAPREN